MSLLIVLLLILVLIIINDSNILEKFGGYQMYQQFIPFYSSGSSNIPSNTYKYPPTTGWWNNLGIPVLNGSTDLPWNNTELGVTSNMSYDLRGDPMVIPRVQVSPWNNPEVYPIYNTGQGVLN